MKPLIQIIAALLLIFIINGCVSSQNKNAKVNSYRFTTDTPFTIVEAYSQQWIAGVQGGGSGTNIFLKFDKINEDVTIKDFYYNEKKVPLKLLPGKSFSYQANFNREVNNDIVMHRDSQKETANTPPVKIPFNLKDNEAVLSYLENDVVKFFKISALPEKPLIAYPQAGSDNKH